MAGRASADDQAPAPSRLPGINRALVLHRTVSVTGADVFGGTQTCAIKVCEVGPFLVLKLNAFAHRQQPKDAFDVYKTVLHYDGCAAAAAQGFRAEAELNSGFDVARDALGAHFATAVNGGPTRCAEFMIGGLQGQMSAPDFAFRRNQIREEMVGVAALLRRE